MQLTKAALKAICREHNLYMTPSLNDVLYCNSGGFTTLTGLEAYCNVKSVFFENNALTDLSTMPSLPFLKCLYLQNNAIKSLEGLDTKAPSLHSLNVSRNQLASLDRLNLAELSTLLCAENRLNDIESIAVLGKMTQLQTLDLQENELADFDVVLDLLATLPELRCLYLAGNPLVRAAPNYRKRLILALPNLCYLDDSPVFDKERRCAEAWATAGREIEAQQAEQRLSTASARLADPSSVLAEVDESRGTTAGDETI
ncbi:hypothetical protein Ndes2526B_g05940 [Nannochloris sp. 'desiccata']|nr:hypothetical protein KSW81_007745 [Chlorella desiccata (nom. nud.)]